MNAIKLLILIASLAVLLSNPVSATTISETEPNDALATAQLIDGWFTLDFDADIQDSTVMPHVSVQATGDAVTANFSTYTYDYYRFTVTAANSQAVFDVDYAYKPGLPGSNDSTIALWDSDGNPLIEEDNTAGDCTIDPGGSVCFKPAGQTEKLLDPFLQYTFATPGQYVVGIAESATLSNPDVGGWYYVNAFLGDIANPLDLGDTYTLHISLAGAIVIPEPATFLLTAAGLLGGAICVRRQNRLDATHVGIDLEGLR